jgi:hypothetical protein
MNSQVDDDLNVEILFEDLPSTERESGLWHSSEPFHYHHFNRPNDGGA